jgi:hypothetical protein
MILPVSFMVKRKVLLLKFYGHLLHFKGIWSHFGAFRGS